MLRFDKDGNIIPNPTPTFNYKGQQIPVQQYSSRQPPPQPGPLDTAAKLGTAYAVKKLAPELFSGFGGGSAATGVGSAGAAAAEGAGFATGGGSSAAATGIGINPLLAGAGFMAAAPLYLPAVSKLGSKVGKLLGIGNDYVRPWNEDEAIASKAIANQIPGFADADEATRRKIVQLFQSKGFIEGARPSFGDDGKELEGTSWQIKHPLMRLIGRTNAIKNREYLANQGGSSLGHIPGGSDPLNPGNKGLAPLNTLVPLDEQLAILKDAWKTGVAVKPGAFSDLEAVLAEARGMLPQAGAPTPAAAPQQQQPRQSAPAPKRKGGNKRRPKPPVVGGGGAPIEGGPAPVPVTPPPVNSGSSLDDLAAAYAKIFRENMNPEIPY